MSLWVPECISGLFGGGMDILSLGGYCDSDWLVFRILYGQIARSCYLGVCLSGHMRMDRFVCICGWECLEENVAIMGDSMDWVD